MKCDQYERGPYLLSGVTCSVGIVNFFVIGLGLCWSISGFIDGKSNEPAHIVAPLKCDIKA